MPHLVFPLVEFAWRPRPPQSRQPPSSRCIKARNPIVLVYTHYQTRASIHISNDTGRVKSFAPDLLSFFSLCTVALFRRMIRRNWQFHSCPTYFARPVSLHRFRCCHQTSLPDAGHDGYSNSLLVRGGQAHSTLRSLRLGPYRPGIPARVPPRFLLPACPRQQGPCGQSDRATIQSPDRVCERRRICHGQQHQFAPVKAFSPTPDLVAPPCRYFTQR